MSIEQEALPIHESTSSTNSLLSSSNTSRLGGLSNSFNSRGNNNGNNSPKGKESATAVDGNVPPPFVINQKSTSNYNNCDDILKHSLSMVDLIFGIYGIELWHYDETCGKLVIANLDESQVDELSETYRVPSALVRAVREAGALPVPNFAAGGIATPAHAALCRILGAESVFVGSGIFKSENPGLLAKAIVQATCFYDEPQKLLEISRGLGKAMPGLEISTIPPEAKLAVRGW